MDQRIELRHLRYFLAVAEELHFGRAAARLHLAQPALSQQIKQFETYLGITLLTRTSRSVQLTEAGEVLKDRAEGLLARLAWDLEEVGRVDRGESGQIHLRFINSTTTTVSEIVSEFTTTHPDVVVRLSTGFTSNVLSALRRGTIDMGIVRDADPDPALVIRPLQVDPFVAVMPTSSPLARLDAVRAADLADYPLVLFPRSAGDRAFVTNMSVFYEAGIDQPVAHELSDWNSIIALVGAGVGVTVAPTTATGNLPPGVSLRAVVGPQTPSDIQLVTRADSRRPAVAALVRHALAVHGHDVRRA